MPLCTTAFFYWEGGATKVTHRKSFRSIKDALGSEQGAKRIRACINPPRRRRRGATATQKTVRCHSDEKTKPCVQKSVSTVRCHSDEKKRLSTEKEKRGELRKEACSSSKDRALTPNLEDPDRQRRGPLETSGRLEPVIRRRRRLRVIGFRRRRRTR
jgi:hypothetical protein